MFSFLTKMSIAALVFEFYNPILTNKIHCTYHKKIMQAANKTNKNERGIGGEGGGLEFGLTELCFPSPGL